MGARRRRTLPRRRSGFTMLEVAVAVGVLASLTVLGVVAVDRGRDAVEASTARTHATSLLAAAGRDAQVRTGTFTQGQLSRYACPAPQTVDGRQVCDDWGIAGVVSVTAGGTSSSAGALVYDLDVSGRVLSVAMLDDEGSCVTGWTWVGGRVFVETAAGSCTPANADTLAAEVFPPA